MKKNKQQKRIVWKLEKRKLSDLKPHEKNPRQFTEKGLKDLESSIDSIGFAQPININKEGTILSGHARVIKLQEMGYDEVDVYVPDRVLTPKQEEEILVRMNANNAGQFDMDKLANEFELEDLKEWGLDLPDIEGLEPLETVGDDEVPEEPVKAITVKGDLYELGKHRLLCGDSTMIDEVEKLLNGVETDCYIDPPYGISYKSPSGKGKTKRGDYAVIHGDTQPFDPSLFLGFFERTIMWGANHYASKLPDSAGWLVWDKREGDAINNNSDCELAWRSFGGSARLFHHKWNGMIKASEKNEQRTHPTQKPVALHEWVFKECELKSNIFDGFLGSGSTLIACEKTKRICYGMELDEKYCDVIIKRYIQFCEANSIKPSVKRNGKNCLKEFK